MSVVDVASLRWGRNELTASDLTASRDDDTSLSAGTVGEIAEAEVGDDSVLSQYDAVQIGQPPRNRFGDRRGNEMFVKLQAGGSDVADTVQFAFNARNKGEAGGGAPGEVTGFLSHRGQDNSDPRQRDPLPPQQPVIPDGRLIILQVKDETASVTVDLSESEFEIPILGGK